MDFVIGGLAAVGACLFSNPFDVIKTRMQLQGELRSRGKHAIFYRNVFHGGWIILKNEGMRGIQKGLPTAMVMHSVRNSTRLGAYRWFEKNGYLTDKNGKTIIWKSATAGTFSGAAGAFLASPLFLIKTQLQSQAAETIAVGTQHHHQGAVAAVRGIYVKHGISGLWRGCSSTVLRACVGSPAQLTSFAIAKDVLKESTVFKNAPTVVTSFIASVFGGIIQTILMNPFDLVSIRLFNQGVDKDGKGLLYKNIGDCFMKVWKTEGFIGFYKGIGANYMRLAPHGALCLMFWDLLKDLQMKYLLKM